MTRPTIAHVDRRSTKEWRGKTLDSQPTPTVRLRVFRDHGGQCHRCKRKIDAQDAWICEHVIAIENGGENRERNLDVTCSWCKPEKDAEDNAVRSKADAMAKRYLGVKPKSRPIRSRNTFRPYPSNTRDIRDDR